MSGELHPGPIAQAPVPAGVTRREAMIQLLRLGGAGVVASGAGLWLSRHSVRAQEVILVLAMYLISSEPILAFF